jgi:pimeloyl-ACP methyl ester carboxylesterase
MKNKSLSSLRFVVIFQQLFILVGLLSVAITALGQSHYADKITWMPAQTQWSSVPAQVPVTEAYVDIDGVKLWYWDTGGDGEAVVLMHPFTGSAAVWGYQQPVLSAAGFRVIAYSRRGHYKSDAGPLDNTGSAVDDLQAVVDHLGLERFHLVGSAGGGFIVPDYAVSHPERLLSITIACSSAGATDKQLLDHYRMIAPKELRARSTWFKELGPSYREANPKGVAEWRALEELATSQGRISQRKNNNLNWDAFATIKTPTLLVTGDADIYQSPPRMIAIAESMVNADPKLVVLSDSGHSCYWEQPVAFNKVLIDFLLDVE